MLTLGGQNARAPYISLKAFKKLQVLHCVWKFILPDRKDDLLHSIYNYYPAESFIENSGVISMVDPTSHPHLLTSYSLRDVIPDSLIVLQLSSCPFDETARGLIIELLSSRHPNLRRIEIDCMIDDELQELAEHAGIDLCSLKSQDVFWRHDTSCECGLHPPFKRWEKPRHKCRTRCPGRTSRYGIFMPPDDGVVDMLNGRPKQQGKPVWRRLFDFISLAGGFRPIFQTS